MRALVTGGSGFVGANLVRRLLVDGHQVHLLLRPEADRWRLEGLEAFVDHPGRVEDRSSVMKAMELSTPDWVFHLAAHGAYSFQKSVGAMVRTNVEGTANLIEAALQFGCAAFVNAGSSSEYGGCTFPPAESTPPNPNSNYAVTKVAATGLCRQAAIASDLPATTLRLYSVYGPWEDPRRLIPVVVSHALRGEWASLNSPDTVRDFVYVDDVVEAFLLAVRTAPLEPGVIYNVGTGVETRLDLLAANVADIYGIGGSPKWGGYPAREWDTSVWVADPARIGRELGWRARVQLREGIQRYSDWLIEQATTADLP